MRQYIFAARVLKNDTEMLGRMNIQTNVRMLIVAIFTDSLPLFAWVNVSVTGSIETPQRPLLKRYN